MFKRIAPARYTRRILVGSVALVTGLALQPDAAAAGRGTELGLDFGMTDLSDNESNDSGTRFGLRGGYNFTPWFQLEGQTSQTKADEAGLEARLNTIFVNGVFNFRPDTRIEPYVLTGVGRANLKVGVSGIGSVDDSGTAYQFGAGSRFYVNADRRLSVRVEVARLHERTFDEGTDYNNITTGVAWRLGRRS